MLQKLFVRGVSLLLVGALLGGCSFATRFAYNNLDWLSKREIGKYVSLNSEQKQDVDTRFDRLWAWHRAEELPQYAADLRKLAAAARRGFIEDDLRSFLDTGEAWAARLAQRGMPDVAAVIATFDDAQIAEILQQVDEENAEYREKYVEPDASERREASAKRMRKSLDKRLGSLSDSQRQRVAQWANARQLNAEAWAAEQVRWRDAFAAVLATRAEPGFAERLQPLFENNEDDLPPELLSSNAYNTRLWIDMILDIDASLSERQRAHLVEHITEFAEDFEALSRKD